MKTSLLVAAITSIMLGYLGGPAAAADLTVSTALRPSSATPDSAPPSLTLKGTVSYDADTADASGTFQLGEDTNTYKGSAWVAGEGFIFDGQAEDETRLFVNFSTDPQGSGTAIFCKRGTQCAFFTSLGGTVSPGK